MAEASEYCLWFQAKLCGTIADVLFIALAAQTRPKLDRNGGTLIASPWELVAIAT